MKMTITTILLALAAGKANADGFSQQVVGDSQSCHHEIGGKAAEFTYDNKYLRRN